MSDRCRKQQVLEAAELVKHKRIYVPKDGGYVTGFASEPVGTAGYETEIEPIVDTRSIYNLDAGSAWLTVNRYNAAVLNSRNMLIGDIDFGDDRLNRHAGASRIEDVVESLESLGRLDDDYRGIAAELRFAAQSYRVYRTCNGCRVICTSRCFPIDEQHFIGFRLMRFLRCDPLYIALCDRQKCYRARLTPKPWRCDPGFGHVCKLEYQHGGDDVHPDLVEQLALHDEMTLPEANCHTSLA
jgi:hypothetical protein